MEGRSGSRPVLSRPLVPPATAQLIRSPLGSGLPYLVHGPCGLTGSLLTKGVKDEPSHQLEMIDRRLLDNGGPFCRL